MFRRTARLPQDPLASHSDIVMCHVSIRRAYKTSDAATLLPPGRGIVRRVVVVCGRLFMSTGETEKLPQSRGRESTERSSSSSKAELALSIMLMLELELELGFVVGVGVGVE